MNQNRKIIFLNQKMNYLLIFILFIFNNLIREFKLTSADFHSSIITIKINKTGMQNILFEGEICYNTRPKFVFPDEVIINGVSQINISAKYNFERENNTIQLIWNESTENWGCLFKNCTNITEIDFSQFDFSQHIQGNMMLAELPSLTSVNLNCAGKLKFKDAGSIFLNMVSITSLNLSNLDMSEVTDISWMFRGCRSLTSLDLTNFQIVNTELTVSNLFYVCPNLEYINLKNVYFKPNDNSYFMSTKKNVVICCQDERIIEEIKKYGCPFLIVRIIGVKFKRK